MKFSSAQRAYPLSIIVLLAAILLIADLAIFLNYDTISILEKEFISSDSNLLNILSPIISIALLALLFLYSSAEAKRRQIEEELEAFQHNLRYLVKAKTLDLEMAKESAEKENSAKTIFLANMSHELRTPMHAILSFSHLGKKKSTENEDLLTYFEAINKSGKRLLLLLNNLLDLSKLEAGKTEFIFVENGLAEVVGNIAMEVKPLLDQKGQELDIIEPEEFVKAEFDKTYIEQVVENLISNAIKFTEENKTITVRFDKTTFANEGNTQQPAVILSVEDEGIGIPEDELDDIFDRFIQSSKTKSGAGGTGLGLAICQEIIAEHHGKIWAENRPEGGCKFSFIIPTKRTNVIPLNTDVKSAA